MKVMTNKALYIQKIDLKCIYLLNEDIPLSLKIKLFFGGVKSIQGDERFEFVKITSRDERDYINQVKYIMDYNVVKSLSVTDIIYRFEMTDKEAYNLIKDTFSQNDNFDDKKSFLSGYLKDMYLGLYGLKKSTGNYELPDGVAYPKDCYNLKRTTKK